MNQMTQTLQLPGYEITELVYHGSRTRVYRGRREIDQHPVAIKVLENEAPNFNDLLKFRNQYSLTKNLDHPQILKSLSLESYGHGYALILEDFGGISLANYWSQYQSTPIPEIPLGEFLKIAIQLTQALTYLYQNRIIHKDIKPANILINPQTHEVKCIDFSIASQLPRESQELDSLNTLEGTLAYLSPEQTGRMNRGIDYRSDFYSLGVTFYELLTGTLPFNSEDTLELIHSHLAVKPPPVHYLNPSIPLPLSQLVSQLMAKNAEDRYQTALGIQADLQVCLDALETTGHISGFKLRERDISDRLMIPEKLYGRAEEVRELLRAFERVSQGQRELMLVAGFSGIGKTSVIQEVHKPIVRQRGYFIKGKYDQFNHNIPLSGLVQALRDLVDQLLSESEAKIQAWGEKILEAIGENGQVLVEVIPELELLIGTPPPVPELSGLAAENRLNLLFKKFLNVFSSANHPLVIFLDDLQWADSTSLKFLKILLEDQDYLLLLGAYRDNEVSPVHPLILTLDELTENSTPIKTLSLSPLDKAHLNALVADTLQCDRSQATLLTNLVYQKTKGNPFFATQFIKFLYDEGLLSFDWQTCHWQCDIAGIKVLAITDDVVEFMALKLNRLPSSSQKLLKLAACIGADFDLNTLGLISQQSASQVALGLWNALQEEFVIPTNQIYKFFTDFETAERHDSEINPRYRFVHDRIQQAAYSLIPEEHKQATHLQIGRLLQAQLSQREDRYFEIVEHLNLAQDLIEDPQEKEAIAQLNLLASRKALKATAYPLAHSLVETGMSLLEEQAWQHQYTLTLHLKTLGVETAYMTGNFELMNQRATEVLAAAKTVLDRTKVYQIQIRSLTAQGRMLEAINLGQIALQELGVSWLDQDNSESMEMNLNRAVARVSQRLQGKSIEDLLHQPEMTDASMRAAMDLCALLFPAVYQASPQLQPLLCATMVSLSLEFGNTPASTLGYASYGMVLSAFLGDVEQGYRFGCLALSLVDSLNVLEFKCLNLLWFGGFIQHRKEPLRSTRLTMREGYLAGMENGDFLNAGYNIINYFYDSVFAGVILEDWVRQIEDYAAILESVKQDSPLTYLKMSQQMAYHLQEPLEEPDVFQGPAYDERRVIPKYQQNNELSGLAYLYTYKIMLAYWFGNSRKALDYVRQAHGCLMALSGTFFAPVFAFYAALSELDLYSELSVPEQAQCWERVERYRQQVAEWSRDAPMNHQHRLLLLEAEMARVLGNKAHALEQYDRAIAQAKTNHYLHEEALANERAAQFYWDWGKTKLAEAYLQEAYYGYARWGAKAKVLDLEQRFSQSLHEIVDPLEAALKQGIMNSARTHTSSHSSHGSSSSISEVIDLEALFKVSQTISEEIELNKLIHTLLTIVISQAGADNCLFLLKDKQDFKLFTLASLGNSSSLSVSREFMTYDELPMSLVNRVKRTLKPQIISNVTLELGLLKDPYFQNHQPKSVLVTPILHQGKLRGILYLENHLTFGAFTGDCIKVLNLICSQAAISLENARLYESAQQALTDLQEAQLKIVQSEKMSTLGNLVAGVAHEINNPVGFLKGNIDPCLDYIQDLLGLIDLYQEKYPDADEDILEEIEAIELDYIREDLPKSLGSMREGVKRIQNISHSLRTFSRGDTQFPVTYDVHEGLDSTLLILKHRLKAQDDRPAIEVIKDYGDLPTIECYAGQLNQVFVNIIGNAIDALEDNSRDRSYHEIENRLVVKTRCLESDNQVMISIEDNGIGMTDMVKKNMFDKLFTTKAVGKGTGLGLPIARKIVVEKHSGTLECFSQFGEGTEFRITLPITSKDSQP